MKIDILNLASLPKKFINGLDKIKIEDSEYRLFVSETLFNAIEDAWNTFHKNYGGTTVT